MKVRLRKVPTPVFVFIFISLLAGSVYIKNIGPFSGPDLYSAHYRASLAVATGQIFAEPVKKDTSRVQYLKGEEKYFRSGNSCVSTNLVSVTITNPLDADDMSKCIYSHDKQLSKDQVEVQSTLQYPFLSYTPQAVGLATGMALDMEPIHAQTLARYLNLLVYVTIVSLAIALIPRGKWLLTFISLLPTSLFLASSLSADSLNIAWNILFVAYILHLYLQQSPMTRKQMAAVFVLGAGLFMLKVAYVPMLLLVLALKERVIKNRDKWLLFFASGTVGAILYVVWSRNWSSLNATVDVTAQVQLILSNMPQAMTGILLNILYLPMRIFEQPSMYIVISIFIIFIVYRTITSAKLYHPSGFKDFLDKYRLQVAGCVAVIGSLGLTYSALLLTWTDVGVYGWTDIQGFQGRYILPLLPLIVLVYYLPEKARNKK